MSAYLDVSPASPRDASSIFFGSKPSSTSDVRHDFLAAAAPARKKQRADYSPIDVAFASFEDDRDKQGNHVLNADQDHPQDQIHDQIHQPHHEVDDDQFDANDDSDLEFEDVEEDVLARSIASELDLICKRNANDSYQPSKNDPIGIFFSTYRQTFTLETYLLRLIRYMDCSKASFIVALVYLDRLQRLDSRFIVSYFNVHRLFLTASVIAAKFLDDSVYKNSHYAFVGGVPCLQEMNLLEEGMLYLLDFNASVDTQTFVKYRALFEELE